MVSKAIFALLQGCKIYRNVWEVASATHVLTRLTTQHHPKQIFWTNRLLIFQDRLDSSGTLIDHSTTTILYMMWAFLRSVKGNNLYDTGTLLFHYVGKLCYFSEYLVKISGFPGKF